MIKSLLGEVHISRPDYQLCDILHVTKAEVDAVFEAGLGADLIAIIGALADIYGADKALEMWTHSAEIYIKALKGE